MTDTAEDIWLTQNQTYLSAAVTWIKLKLGQLAAQNHSKKQQSAAGRPLFSLRGNQAEADATDVKKVSDREIEQAAEALQQAANISPPPALVQLEAQHRFGLSQFEKNLLLLCLAMEMSTEVADLCAKAQGRADRAYPTFALALVLFPEESDRAALSSQGPLRHWQLVEIIQPGSQTLLNSSLRIDERIANYLFGLPGDLDDRLMPLIAPVVSQETTAWPDSQQQVLHQLDRQLMKGMESTILMGKASASTIQLVGEDAPSQLALAKQAVEAVNGVLYRLPAELLPQQFSEIEVLARLWARETRLPPQPWRQTVHQTGPQQQTITPTPLVLFLDAYAIDEGQGAIRQALLQFLHRTEGICLLCSQDRQQRVNQSAPVVEILKPTAAEQRLLWQQVVERLIDGLRAQTGERADGYQELAALFSAQMALPEIAPDSPALLASQFHLNSLTIQQVGETVFEEMVQVGEMERRSPDELAEGLASLEIWLIKLPDVANAVLLWQMTIAARLKRVLYVPHWWLWETCLSVTRPRLTQLAQRLEVKATWAQLVLPTEPMRSLRQIVDQVQQRSTVYEQWGFQARMNRGMGISALFSGESGTGKTMAAEVIANALRLDLYRIDLSAVVSKYIGETEKNLRRLFDAAENSGAILFFDEADALFGKRSEVRDSHDRYANIEINYLLQRIEAYRGLAILATNMKSALDSAFMRRLRFSVVFPFPDVAQRQEMWRKAFPPETPTQGLNYARLARLNLTGGNIHSIALNAAFAAAQMGSSVTMELVLAAARTEFLKLERPINEAEFRWRRSSSGRGLRSPSEIARSTAMAKVE